MAKTQAHSVPVMFGQILNLPPFNMARQSGSRGTLAERKERIKSLAEDGWWTDVGDAIISGQKIAGAIWMVDGKEVELKSFVKPAMEDRQRMWDFHRNPANVDLNKENKLKVFEKLYTRNGKLIPVDVVNISGNCRIADYEEAMVIRCSLKNENEFLGNGTTPNPDFGKGFDIPDTVMMMLNDFSDERFRLVTQRKENAKTVGLSKSTPEDDVMTAKSLLALDMNQNDVRKAIPQASGIRSVLICQLSCKYPRLEIFNRCLLAPGSEGWISLTSVGNPKLQEFSVRMSPSKLETRNKLAANRGHEIWEPLTEDAVREYFADVKKNPAGNGAKKMADKNVIEQDSKTGPGKTAQIVAERYYTNVVSPEFKRLHDMATCDDSNHILWEDGDGPDWEKIGLGLRRIPKGEVRNAALKACIAIVTAKA